VLLAEDNWTNSRFLQIVLEDCGHHVVAVADGTHAVEAVQKEAFDVVLMDVQMPMLDGLSAARQIRALGGAASRIPIIALTAFAMRGDEERCLEAGMNAYVSKPVDLDRLADDIRRLCPKG
jgi:CheY-like chemotaxis protein